MSSSEGLGMLALRSRCLSRHYCTAYVSPLICLTVTLSRLGESKSARRMHGIFGDPNPPAAKGHSWIDIPFILCPSTMPLKIYENHFCYFRNIFR